MAEKKEWVVLYDEEFGTWLREQEAGLYDTVLSYIKLLKELGPNLRRPRVGTIDESEFSNMKEIVVQYKGEPWRILFAFDPNQAAVLLHGGCKVGDKRWYKTSIPIADARFKKHIQGLKKKK